MVENRESTPSVSMSDPGVGYVRNRREGVEVVLNDATELNLMEYDQWLDSIATPDEWDTGEPILSSQQTSSLHLRNKNGCIGYPIPPCRFASAATEKKKGPRSAKFVINWVQKWNDLVTEDGDDFGDMNPLFRACCHLFFDVRVMILVGGLTFYCSVVCLGVSLFLDSEHYQIYIGTLVADLVLWFAYYWGAWIFKGDLWQGSMMGDDTRVAKDTAELLEDTTGIHQGLQLEDQLVEGTLVYARFYEEGLWRSAEVVKVHVGDGRGGDENTYDVLYDYNDQIETRVKLQFIRIRNHSSTPVPKLIFNVCFEMYTMLPESCQRVTHILCCCFPIFFEVTKKAQILLKLKNAKDRRWTANSTSGDDIVLNQLNLANALTNKPAGDVEESGIASSRSQQAALKTYQDSLYREALNRTRYDSPIKCGFYEMLDCTHKYIARKRRSRLNNFARWLTFAVLIFCPAMNCALWGLLYHDRNNGSPFLTDAAHCHPSNQCKASLIYFFMTGAYVLGWVQQSLLYIGVLLIFSGLLYGCDAVHYLSKGWQERYARLRRITRVKRTVNEGDDGDSDDGDHGPIAMQVKATSGDQLLYQEDTDRLFLLLPIIKRGGCEHYFVVLLFSLLHGIPFSHYPDAYERYLLLFNFTKAFSAQWSMFLFTQLLIVMLMTGVTYYLLIRGDRRWGYFLALGVETLAFIYPVYCLGYANKHVNNILAKFRRATPDDFAAMGNMDEWRQFVADNQVYWTIMGLPITFAVLKTYFYTAATTAPVVLTFIYTALGDEAGM